MENVSKFRKGFPYEILLLSLRNFVTRGIKKRPYKGKKQGKNFYKLYKIYNSHAKPLTWGAWRARITERATAE